MVRRLLIETWSRRKARRYHAKAGMDVEGTSCDRRKKGASIARETEIPHIDSFIEYSVVVIDSSL